VSEEYVVIYVTKGLAGRVIRANKPYVVVDKDTLAVIDSSDKSLVGKKWNPPKPIRGTTSGTASIPQPPLPFQVALWTGRAQFTHESIVADLPPGVTVEVEIFPKERGMVQYLWAMTFGDLVDSLVVIKHEVRGMMKWHEDPLIKSIVDTVYPLNIKVSEAQPHRCLITNEDTVTVTVEATFWMIETDSAGAELIDNMFEGLGKLLLGEISTMAVSLEPLVDKLNEVIKKLDEVVERLKTVRRDPYMR
jgi:hypothetical protein